MSIKTINILSIIDVETILKNKIEGGTFDEPTFLGNANDLDDVYMITAQGYIDHDGVRASAELIIDANPKDTIQWELTCPGSGMEYNAIIANVTIGRDPGAFTPPKPHTVIRKIYEKAGNSGYQLLRQTDYIATVLPSKNITQYWITFQIMGKSGESLGFYYWDPYVKVLDTPTFQKERAAYLEKKKTQLA